MGTDWGALYTEHVEALSAWARDLDDEQLATVVPASPEWTVRDVLSHLAGVASDTVSGSMDGAPGPAWTARHVAGRADRNVEDVVAELDGLRDQVIATAVDNPRPAAIWDVVVHHADLHEALGRGRMAERMWRPVLDAVALPALTAAAPSSYEHFRARFSRRSVGQVVAWGVEPAAAAESGIFGPRDDDQPVPD